MTEYLNKSDFITGVGRMYYLWKGRAGKTIILYLGNNKQDFQKYIEDVKSTCRRSGRISFVSKKSRTIENAIAGYLDGKIKKFDFEIEFLIGTQFQKSIWKGLLSVPYGETISYKELSFISGYEKAWRAAGSALNRNPVILVIPCHRVIKSDGSIGRFASGPELKEFLLNLESSNMEKNNSINGRKLKKGKIA